MRQKLVIISQVFHPDPQATSQLLSGLAKDLVGNDMDLEVLCGYPTNNFGPKLVSPTEEWMGITIIRGGLKVDAKKSFGRRALAYFTFCIWLAWRLLFRVNSNTQVLVVTNPPFAPLLVYACNFVKKGNYNLLLHDIYPDGLVAVGMLRRDGLIERIWRGWNRRAYASARRVIVLGRDMAALCRSRYGVDSSRICIIPNWSPVNILRPKNADESRMWREMAGLHGKFVVQYSGNMGLWHDIETIVQASLLLHDEPLVHFVMIGSGLRRQAAFDLSRLHALKNITWLPYQPEEALEDSLSCCHASIISQRAGLSGVAVPCKLYGILASGRPIIAQVPADSETAFVVEEEQCGVLVPPGDARALADAIVDLARNPAASSQMGRRAFAAYQSKYSRETGSESFRRLFAV